MSFGIDLCLLCFYNDEFVYLCEDVCVFGEEYEVVVGWLGLKILIDFDFYVECLLEGVVYLGVCVQFKIVD